MPVRATAAGGPERTRMAGVYYALDRDNLLDCVTHLCPLGPVAYGSGPTGVRRGTLDKAWLERVEGADIRRAGPTWAVGQDYVVVNADPNHGSDWDERHLFRSRIRPLFRADIHRDRDPIPTQWIPRLHLIQPTVPVSSAVHSRFNRL